MPDVTPTHVARDSVPKWRVGNTPGAAWSYSEGVRFALTMIEVFTNFDMSLLDHIRYLLHQEIILWTA